MMLLGFGFNSVKHNMNHIAKIGENEKHTPLTITLGGFK